MPWPCFSRLSTFIHPHAIRHDLRRRDCWLALLSVSLGCEKLPWIVNFLHGLKLREMPCFKGFRLVSIIKAKKSFIFSSLFIGNSESMF